jgi:DNA polymerase type B, organellar and viral
MGRGARRSRRGIIQIHNCKEALELERGAYYGGRCDVFRYGHVAGPIYQLDVNSLYPSAMLAHAYPVRLLGVEQGPAINRVDELLQSCLLCAHVHIHSGRQTYPLRDSLGSRMVLGDFTTFLATPELSAALQGQDLARCYSVAYYAGADIFSKYVSTLYDLRRQAICSGNANGEIAYKLLLNSLYGKWAQQGTVWAECDRVRPARLWGTWSEREGTTGLAAVYRAIGGTVEREIPEGEWIHSYPAIAAHITSYGRERLRELIQIARLSNVYYCDTDSLLCSRDGVRRLHRAAQLRRGVLGSLRFEGLFPEGEIRGRKNYRLGGDAVYAGATITAAEHALRAATIDKSERVATTISSGPLPHVQHETVELDLSRNSLRGAIMPDGRVLPEVVGDATIEVDPEAL